MTIPEEENALLEDSVRDSVDHRGNPAGKSSTGRWKSARLIIGVEVAERFAYVGIACNLITYLTGPLGQSTATAAVNVNTWIGTASTLPIIGAFVADAYLGRYRTILVASFIYILGLGSLTLSASLTIMGSSDSSKPSFLVNLLFFCSLYLVAIGQGGHKPCVQAFGADQFDSEDPKERIARGSFFNWWFLSLSAGIALSIIVMVYIQTTVNWAFGFGIPCLFMVMALAIFFLGRKTYRYPKRKPQEKNALARIGRVFVGMYKNRKLSFERSGLGQGHLEDGQSSICESRLLEEEPSSNSRDVEDAKGLVRLIPVWFTTMVSMVPYAQYSTFFTKQGVTVDRQILPGLEIPPASLLSFISMSVLISVPIYERVFLPIARSITKKPFGITMIQRIGAGMVLSSFNMVLAALVEAKRLQIAHEHGLIDKPDATVPMSIWWFVPQYMLVGMIEVFALVGAQEFFYDQVPTELRSIGLAFSLSAMGLSNFLSGLLIIVVDWATRRDGGDSWFNTNLNRAHLDYFYWLLAAFTAVAFFAFLFISRSYVYRREWSSFSTVPLMCRLSLLWKLYIYYDEKLANEKRISFSWIDDEEFFFILISNFIGMISHGGIFLDIFNIFRGLWIRLLTALLWKEVPWKPPWKRQHIGENDVFSLLYGDVLRIVENWQFQYLFLSKESIDWILYDGTFIDMNWKLANVIQQRELVFQVQLIAEVTNGIKSKVMKKKNNRDDILLAGKNFQGKASPLFISFILLCFQNCNNAFHCHFSILCTFDVTSDFI